MCRGSALCKLNQGNCEGKKNQSDGQWMWMVLVYNCHRETWNLSSQIWSLILGNKISFDKTLCTQLVLLAPSETVCGRHIFHSQVCVYRRSVQATWIPYNVNTFFASTRYEDNIETRRSVLVVGGFNCFNPREVLRSSNRYRLFCGIFASSWPCSDLECSLRYCSLPSCAIDCQWVDWSVRVPACSWILWRCTRHSVWHESVGRDTMFDSTTSRSCHKLQSFNNGCG